MKKTERFSDATGNGLKPPYTRIMISLQRVHQDEKYAANEGEPGIVDFPRMEFDVEDLTLVNEFLAKLNHEPIVDDKGFKPALKSTATAKKS